MTTLLTEWLYIAAQMPHGTHAQQNVFRAAQRAGRFGSALALPVRGAKRLAAELRDRGIGPTGDGLPSEEHFDAVVRNEAQRQAREQPLAGPPWSRPIYPEPRAAIPPRPRLAAGLRPLSALRLAGDGGADRRGRAAAAPARDARRPQPAPRRPGAAERVMPVLATEAWPAIFGGLIPIVGLVAIGYIIVRAARDNDDADDE